MRQIASMIILVSVLLAAACSPAQPTTNPAQQPTMVKDNPSVPTATMEPTATFTPAPTMTQTSIPTLTSTPIGAISPKMAVYGKDDQGNIDLYVGELYSDTLASIARIDPGLDMPEKQPMKWSPDGKKLVFVNQDPQKGRSVFLYDVESKTVKLVTGIDHNILEIHWLPGQKAIVLCMDIDNWRMYHLLDLDTGKLTKLASVGGLELNWLNGPLCSNYEVPPDTLWNQYGPRLCSYQGTFYFTKYDDRSNTVSLVSVDGKQTMQIAKFDQTKYANNMIWMRFLNLNISPDQSALLVSAKLDVWMLNVINFSEMPKTISQQMMDSFQYEQKVVDQNTTMYLNTDQINLNSLYAFGWSPDSKNIVLSKGLYHYLPSKEMPWGNYEAINPGWKIGVIDAKSQQFVYDYTFPKSPQFVTVVNPDGYIFGFDVVWPNTP